MKRFAAAAVAAFALASVSGPTLAAGNIASKATHIEIKIDGAKLTYSQTEIQLETGKYYILDVSSDGAEEIMFRSPDLIRNSWISQVSINDVEVHTNEFYGVEFDEEGTASIFFVPLRPGNYEFFSPGFEERGLKGTFVVR